MMYGNFCTITVVKVILYINVEIDALAVSAALCKAEKE